MNVLVSGGAGYIGSVLVPMLVEEGYNVTVIDNFLYSRSGANSLASLCRFPNFSIHRVDVRDPAAWKPFVAKADVVIPLAALVGAPICNLNTIDAELVNYHHPRHLFKTLSQDQLCIMPTTESAYGSNAEVCTEETPINPLSTYALHKAHVEEALLQRENSISLRLATVYGMSPRMRLDLLVNDFSWKAWKEGSILLFEHHFNRTVLHVRDAAFAFLHVIRDLNDQYQEPPMIASFNDGDIGFSTRERIARGQIYNVGNDTVTKLSLCEMLKDKLPKFHYSLADIGSDPDQRNYIVSSEKLKRTGFEYSVSLDDGIEELLKGFPMLTNTLHGNV